MSAFIVILVVLAVAGFFVWKSKSKVIALVQSQTQPGPIDPSPPAQVPAAKSPVDPTVSGIVLGTATEALLGGKPTANGPAYTGPAVDQTRYDTNFDTPSVSYRFEKGVKLYTMPTNPGSVYSIEAVPSNDGYANGTVTITRDGSEPLVLSLRNGSLPRTPFQALGNVTAILVSADAPGLIRRLA